MPDSANTAKTEIAFNRGDDVPRVSGRALPSVVRPFLQWLSPAGPRSRLSVLIFHRVLARCDPLFPLEVDARRFDEICRWVGDWFNILPLDEAVERLKSASLPARALAITFDDGYADNHDVALPILKRHGLVATFFVTTGYLDGGRMWNDTVIESVRRTSLPRIDLSGLPFGVDTVDVATPENRAAVILRLVKAAKYLDGERRSEAVSTLAERSAATLPCDLMMTSNQVKSLHREGMQLGAHTVTHPILSRLRPDEARREIEEGKHALQSILGDRVSLFAYPNGRPGEDYLPEHVEMVRRAGLDGAFTTVRGSAGSATNPFELPRFSPWNRNRLRFGLSMARTLRQG